MAQYTTATEIQSDFKDITFSTTSNVKTADVEQFIIEADAIINSYIAKRYVAPLDDDDAEGFALLKTLSRALVTARIKSILQVKQSKNIEANQDVVGILFSPTQVMKILRDIQSGEIDLIGATLLSSNLGFFNNNYEEDVEPVMTKDTKQW